MRLHTIRSTRPPGRRSGLVLILVLVFTGVIILLASSMSGSSNQQIQIRRDEIMTLRAELAAEAGVEYARRMLAIDADWDGTGATPVALSGGSSFQVEIGDSFGAGDGVTDVSFAVDGMHADAAYRIRAEVRVTVSGLDPYPYALLHLGEDFTMSHGMVYGDVLFADRAFKVNDWLFDGSGEGYYAEGAGPEADGAKQFVCTGVDGIVYKYRDDLPDYQWLGKEQVIQDNTWMPSWDLDEYLVPGPGKKILTNPHNLGNQTWKLNGLTYEETVVIQLTNKQTVTLTNCQFKGGLVVICPEDYDHRSGARNLVHLKKGTTIGGGAGGLAPHIGLIAPGGNLKSDNAPVSIAGLSLVNDVDLFKNSTIIGQLVILNDVKDIRDCTITHDPAVTSDLPPGFGYGLPVGTTRLLSLFEDFE